LFIGHFYQRIIIFLVRKSTTVVVKPTAKLYKKPKAKLKAAESLDRGRTVKLQSTKPVRGWYQVTIIPDTQPSFGSFVSIVILLIYVFVVHLLIKRYSDLNFYFYSI
jgi:hypothetical protein